MPTTASRPRRRSTLTRGPRALEGVRRWFRLAGARYLAAAHRLTHRPGLGDQGVGVGGLDLLAAQRAGLGDEGAECVTGPRGIPRVEVLLRRVELREQGGLDP